MTLKCQNCGHIFESIKYNFCSECGLNQNSNYNDNNLKKYVVNHNSKISIFKIRNKIAESNDKIHLKFNQIDLTGITNLKYNLNKITSFSHDVTSNIVNEIKENVDGGFDKFKDKIMINVDASLKAIIKTASNPNVIMVAKALSKHSPQIAMVISSCVLAGLPYGSVITQIAGFAVNQYKSGGISSTNKNMNIVNSSSMTPIIETIVNQLLPNSSKSTVSEKCINCSYPVIANSRFCNNCGKEIIDIVDAENLVNSKSGGISSTNKNMNIVNSSSMTPIIETIVNQLLPNSSKSTVSEKCINCSYPVIANSRFCNNCGKEIIDIVDAENLVNSKSGGISSTNKNMNIVNSSSMTPIIETIVNQLLPNSSKSTVSEKCINCSYPVIANSRFCNNCGKEIIDIVDAENLVNSKSGGISSTNKNMNIVNSSSMTPIIETIVNQLLPNSSKSTVSEKCINCSYPVIANSRFCNNCGKEIIDIVDAENLVNS